MAPSRKDAARIVCVVGGGLVTLFLAPMGIAFTFGIAFPYESKESLLGLIWGLASTSGVIAFWVWFFSKSPMSKERRAVVTGGLVGGCLAVAPLFVGAPVLAIPAAVGIVTALVAMLEMWLPNNAFEADHET